MPLTDDQCATLLKLIASSEPDELDCDGCLSRVSEFAEIELQNLDVPEALKAVQRHLDQCVCCKYEYSALLEGLKAMARGTV